MVDSKDLTLIQKLQPKEECLSLCMADDTHLLVGKVGGLLSIYEIGAKGMKLKKQETVLSHHN